MCRLDAFADLADALAALRSLSTALSPSPCPFLREEGCSIHEARPVACWLWPNPDDNPLCRQVQDQDIPVPHAHSTVLEAMLPMP